MKTVTNKLTQEEWHEYVAKVDRDIAASGVRVHFFGGPSNHALWQNVAWVVEGNESMLVTLKRYIMEDRARFFQDSAAWIEGTTEFV